MLIFVVCFCYVFLLFLVTRICDLGYALIKGLLLISFVVSNKVILFPISDFKDWLWIECLCLALTNSIYEVNSLKRGKENWLVQEPGIYWAYFCVQLLLFSNYLIYGSAFAFQFVNLLVPSLLNNSVSLWIDPSVQFLALSCHFLPKLTLRRAFVSLW